VGRGDPRACASHSPVCLFLPSLITQVSSEQRRVRVRTRGALSGGGYFFYSTDKLVAVDTVHFPKLKLFWYSTTLMTLVCH
jgi:hypothetical protein